METVSVEEALRKGQRMVDYPTKGILIIGGAIDYYLISARLIDGFWILLAIILPFLVAWLWWSVMVTKWRLWAFENVRNVHQLEREAVRLSLIWPRGSFFEKTEIRTAAEDVKWADLQQKFLKDDVFTDDLSVPQETRVYISKMQKRLEFGLGVLVLAVGLFFCVLREDYVMGSFFVLVGLLITYIGYRGMINRKPQIIINENGIQTASAPFTDWREVYNEEAYTDASGKNSRNYLSYNCPSGLVKIEISDLDIARKTLSHLLIVYRGRSKQRKGI